MKIDAFGSGLELHRAGERARGIADAGFDGLWIAEAGRTAYLTCAATALAAPELDLGNDGAVAGGDRAHSRARRGARGGEELTVRPDTPPRREP
jgi:hypothetical protein